MRPPHQVVTEYFRFESRFSTHGTYSRWQLRICCARIKKGLFGEKNQVFTVLD